MEEKEKVIATILVFLAIFVLGCGLGYFAYPGLKPTLRQRIISLSAIGAFGSSLVAVGIWLLLKIWR